ncbi:sterol desaturase/sphingolipid hydroxylase (fatty acid hydroxylase superfamily) [Paraburkholderia fungorum]|uniref:Sterol desaturase/sphingolipid hydroxylase (Fatty acid hydroxylase superfamily) n=2 Tax=Paraburkholderia fungorum TaxID=134537 RepID=A0AAW3UVG2_9BURK|nr:sterol desaturase/sphingolipid hydroxylase (fatty acid hydroxylase superfamily) [Paraburkholderia fungorum]
MHDFTADDTPGHYRYGIVMEELGKFTLLVTAFVIAVSMVEAVWLTRKNRSTATPFAWHEVWLSLADVFARKLLAMLPLSLAAPVFAFAWEHRIFTVELNSALTVLALFIGQEFCYYWYHRASHRIRFFWATHAVHHSPNQLTLSTAYRLGVTGKLTGSAIFFAPLVWLGVRPEVVLLTLFFNLMYQFWLHATWIPKLGWLEYVFNTPSSHRVHHASNVDYLDANYGGVLIIFDRLFGTYVGERADEPCRYGLVTPTTSRNPFVVEFEHWATLVRDVVKAKSVWTAINHVIRPPGWTPEGGGETTEELRRRSEATRRECEVPNG